MSADSYELVLPETNSIPVIAGLFWAIPERFGRELWEFVDNRFASQGAADWFEQIRELHSQPGRPFMYDEPWDPRFLLWEQKQPESRLRSVIPNWDFVWMSRANAVRKQLNQWVHYSLEPSLHNLRLFAINLMYLIDGFELEGFVDSLIKRCDEIINGAYRPKREVSDPVSPTLLPTGLTEVIRDYGERPPIGSEWTKKVPTRSLNLIKSTRELIENGVSVKSQLGPDANRIIDKWFTYFPHGGQVFVDSASQAVVAYRKGDAYLIGWFGDTPGETSSTIRGFFTEREYRYEASDVIDLETNRKLSEQGLAKASELLNSLAESVKDGETLLITDYGDIAVETEEPPFGFRKVGVADAASWFKGHLPE